MNRMIGTLACATLAIAAALGIARAQENRIDLLRPDAPELAVRGEDAVGVRTLKLVHKDQPDIQKVEPGKPIPRYDRPLTVEVWYPAAGTPAEPGSRAYDGVLLRDGKKAVTLYGAAMRDAPPKTEGKPFPVIIVSHGYPGNRFLMSHLAENLASKGYVVASIDHTDSTYSDQGKFGSTLVNRPIDQLFVLDEMQRLSAEGSSFLSGMVDAERAGLVGYSMGGYGAVITAGAGVTEASTKFSFGAPENTLAVNQAGSATHTELVDERFKAIIAIAPWGMQRGFFDADALAKVQKPVMLMAGSKDDTSDYEKGIRRIYEGMVNADRYLLTFANANHNAAAPMPAPVQSWKKVDGLKFVPFDHYADPVWDSVRMNNIAQHFATAFFLKYLKDGEERAEPFLDVIEDSGAGVYARNEDGSFKPEHTYWKGFQDRTAAGLRLEHAPAGSN